MAASVVSYSPMAMEVGMLEERETRGGTRRAGRCKSVLLNAIVEYVDSYKPSPNLEVAQRRREARKVAESWFAGDPGAPIEFELCCSMFGMSGDHMRAKIRALTRRLSAPWN